MGDQTLANGYFPSASTSLNLDATETKGRILPQICSSHTKSRVLCRQPSKVQRPKCLSSLQKIIARGFLLLSSCPLKFPDCFPLNGHATPTLPNVTGKNTIATRKQARIINKLTQNSQQSLLACWVTWYLFPLSNTKRYATGNQPV